MIYVAQLVGVLAVVTYLISYQMKKRKHIISVNALSSVLYVLQYILLGAYEGAVLDVLSALSTVSAHSKEKENIKRYSLYIFLFINFMFILSGIILYKNIFSIFPVVGSILQTGAFWLINERRIRLVSFIGAPFWLVYNLLSMAYGSAVGNVLCLISIGIAIFRYDMEYYKKIFLKTK